MTMSEITIEFLKLLLITLGLILCLPLFIIIGIFNPDFSLTVTEYCNTIVKRTNSLFEEIEKHEHDDKERNIDD